MLTDLKFVQGAVAKKDYQPALTHFRIAGGRVVGYNGTIALSSPIALDLTASPKAVPFVKAIERCTDDTTVVHLTPGGRISLKSGRFQAFIECSEDGDVLDAIVPEGELIKVSDNFLEGIIELAPFISNDASRPWANGILLRGYSAYATNNIIVAQYWLGENMPDINLPATAIRELSRISVVPERIQLGERSITFFFPGDRWLRSQLFSTDWPDVDSLLVKATEEHNAQNIPDGLFDTVETLTPFVEEEGRVFFRENKISTVPEGDIGASVEITGLPNFGAYNFKHLLSLRGVASTIDFTMHPLPCPFFGPKLRGVFLGMRDE